MTKGVGRSGSWLCDSDAAMRNRCIPSMRRMFEEGKRRVKTPYFGWMNGIRKPFVSARASMYDLERAVDFVVAS